MFRSHRHSFGRTHTVTLGILAAGLLSTSVRAAAAPDHFVIPANTTDRSASEPSGAPQPGTRLLGRITHGVPGPGSPDNRHCFADARVLIAGRSGCDGATEDLARQAALGGTNLAATRRHRDVPHPSGHKGPTQTDTAE